MKSAAFRDVIGARIGLLVLTIGSTQYASAASPRWLCLDHNGHAVERSSPCPESTKQPEAEVTGAAAAVRYACLDERGERGEQSHPCAAAAPATRPAESVATPGVVRCMGTEGQIFETFGACPESPRPGSSESRSDRSEAPDPRRDATGLASQTSVDGQAASRSASGSPARSDVGASADERSHPTASSISAPAPVSASESLPPSDGGETASMHSMTSDRAFRIPAPVAVASNVRVDLIEPATGPASLAPDGEEAARVAPIDDAKTGGASNLTWVFGALLALGLGWMLRGVVRSRS